MTCISYLPGNQSCKVTLPISKSIINRLLVINFLSGGTRVPGFEKEAADIVAMQRLMDEISLNKGINNTVCELNVGNAGTVMRFLTAVLAVTPGNWLITGSERMLKRPLKPLTDALLQMGAGLEFTSQKGYPPIHIKGKPDLNSGKVKLDSGISSQFISAVMMIGPTLDNDLEIELQGDIASGSYIRMTEALMQKAGAEVNFEGNHIRITGKNYKKFEFPELAEPDWSAAAFWFEIAALSQGTEVLLQGLTPRSVQGDSVLPEIFVHLGVASKFTSEGLQIEKSGIPALSEFNYDFTNCPDLAQAVIVTAAALGIKGHFTGLKTLRVKETDRIEALRKELTRLGYRVDVTGDEIFLPGGKPAILSTAQPVVIHCYDDHRMAMSFAPLAILHDKICLDEPQVIRKSYPGYWADIAKAGFALE